METHGASLCPLHKRLDEATAHMEASFATTTIAELLRQPGRSTPFCDERDNRSVDIQIGLARPVNSDATTGKRRNEALIGFSRDHSLALAVARHLIESADKTGHERRSAIAELMAAWRSSLAEHFDEEERLLIPVICSDPLATRLNHERAVVRGYVELARLFGEDDVDPSWVCAGGSTIRKHVQWEEPELFPAIETSVPPEELQREAPGL